MTRRPPPALASLLCAAALGGCAAAGYRTEWVIEHPLGCRLDEQRLVRDTLYFGRSMPAGGEVDEAAWRAFEHEVVARAFPQGYTLVDADGRWRAADGSMASERSRVLLAVHADDPASEERVREVVARYRERFRQESVLRERTAVCASP